MQAFEIEQLILQQQKESRPYLEFIRQTSMSVGIYRLNAGDVDRQKPHAQDELYYIIQGKGVINVAGDDRSVNPGTLVFVPAKVEHFFHFITEDLITLVFFAPAETGH
ncbi:MAG: cupin domain-containing protein [Ardenticatenaceae bacterium]|nr:cupin domain-containing protein [Ardenticatenaceae bacterium]